MGLLVLSADHLSPYRKPMPSFTLVLTSGRNLYRPSTIQSPLTMLPTAPDFLMRTIDLRCGPTDDGFVEDREENVDLQNVIEVEEPGTIDDVAEQTSTKPVKNVLFLIRKFCERKLVGRQTVPFKPSPN